MQPNLPLDQNQAESYFFLFHNDTCRMWMSTWVKTCSAIRMSEPAGLVSVSFGLVLLVEAFGAGRLHWVAFAPIGSCPRVEIFS